MADRRVRIGRALSRLGRRLGPAARLARADVTLMRGWLHHRQAVSAQLGEGTAKAYTRLVLRIAESDTDTARSVALGLPDQLARVDDAARGRFLKLLSAVASSQPEAMPLVMRTLPPLLDQMDDASLSRYLARALELHTRSAHKAESFLRVESGEAMREASALQKGLSLASISRTLTLYARAHCGEDVQVRPGGENAFTDGRHLYLPSTIDRFNDERDFLVYRVLTARNAGYLEFGTLDLALDDVPGTWPERQEDELELERMLRGFPNQSLARDLFTLLENARVEAQVRTEYPGIARDMDTLADAWRPSRPSPDTLAPAEQAVEWLARRAIGLEAPTLPDTAAEAAARGAAETLEAVRAPDATVHTTIAALQRAYDPIDQLMRRVREDDLRPPELPDGPGGGPPDPSAEGSPDAPQPDPPADPRADRRDADDAEEPHYQPLTDDPLAGALRLDQMSAADRRVEDRARELLTAMRAEDAEASAESARQAARRQQTYDEMAALLDRLEAPEGPLAEGTMEPSADTPLAASAGDTLGEDATTTGAVFLYPEWDGAIEDHKPDWVRVREYRLQPGSREFVERVRQDHGPLITRIRRAFEALRPEALWRERGVLDGDEIDIDRAVADLVERRAGGSPSGRIYARRRPRERDVAVAFLVDMSSSTNEVINAAGKRIIEIEKEALVLTAEAVDAIGDSCAIWGFSGYGRDQVAFYEAKAFTDKWDDTVCERIGRMSWKMENRDGAAIRHATVKLMQHPARVRLLLLLSDGKPLDCGCDHYADRYAQEDTRVALNEARQQGIHPFCITVDPRGHHYLERVYGEFGYTVIDRVETLPLRLTQLYRRLTR